MRLEGLRSIEECSYLIGNGTHDLLACSIVPQPTMVPRAPIYVYYLEEIQCLKDNRVLFNRKLVS
jgi:hypothetical protein